MASRNSGKKVMRNKCDNVTQMKNVRDYDEISGRWQEELSRHA